MKVLIMVLMVLISGCKTEKIEDAPRLEIIEPEKPVAYIVAGQSNAVLCDWSYFESLTGSEVIMLAEGGKTIGYLYNNFENKKHLLEGVDAKAILFVHGESDAMNKNQGYAKKVEDYRVLLGDKPLLISNVGYFDYHKTEVYPDAIFDRITSQVNEQITSNSKWFLAFDDSRYFRDWGMLQADGVHFTEVGCMMMMDAMAESTYKYID